MRAWFGGSGREGPTSEHGGWGEYTYLSSQKQLLDLEGNKNRCISRSANYNISSTNWFFICSVRKEPAEELLRLYIMILYKKSIKQKNLFFPFVFLSVDSLVNRFISVLLSVHALLVCWVWLALEWKWPSVYLHSCCVANWHTAKLIQCTEVGGSQEQTLYWCFWK